MLVSQIASYILGLFFVMYTARYLGVEGFGINPFRKSVYKTFRKSFIKKASRKMLRISFALAFTGIFGVFSDLGLSTLTAREAARDKSLARKYFGNIALNFSM